MPFYQKHVALQKTMDQLRFQIHPDDQIIIVDDYSPDGKPSFNCKCTEVIQPPEEIKPHIYRLNTLRNYGVEHAKHDPCIIIDPDCIPNKNFLRHARRVYDPSVFFTGAIMYLDEKGMVFKEDPRKVSKGSRWVDKENMSCGMVWGGCMYFSKRRAGLIGGFDTDFDGTWGSEEHVFASACRNSGMRLRYDKNLMVYHQIHEKERPGYIGKNRLLFFNKVKVHREALNLVTPYNPAVVVLVVSMLRPYYVDQVMRSIFRHIIPLKVQLVNNGDQSDSQEAAISWWSDRWAVDYVNFKKRTLLSTIRTRAMKKYSEKGYKYIIMIDDDITPMFGSFNHLILEMEKNPQFHALSGYIIGKDNKKRFIGGKKKYGIHYYYNPVTPETREADYTSSGFTIIRLNKVIPYSGGWEMGWNDWDWSNEVTKQGLKVGVTGKAGAYHRHLLTPSGTIYKSDPSSYRYIRYDGKRHKTMADLFAKKWGYRPQADRPLTEEP